jgi:hypothetical protein
MSRAIVVSVSVGTGLFIGCLVLMLCVAIGATLCIDSTEPTMAPAIFKPKSGAIGDSERAINDLKYGPVNLDAAKEIKNGLFARIRDTRHSRICVPVEQQACVTVQTPTVIDPTDCTYSHAITQPQPYEIQATGIESPSDALKEYPAINPLEPQSGDCPTCRPSVEIEKLLRKKVSPRSESKTGAFICSGCRKSHVGEEWHTDWAADGTPITFLCESCYSRMSSQQRIEAYQAYASRQTIQSGRAGLLHQEIGE